MQLEISIPFRIITLHLLLHCSVFGTSSHDVVHTRKLLHLIIDLILYAIEL